MPVSAVRSCLFLQIFGGNGKWVSFIGNGEDFGQRWNYGIQQNKDTILYFPLWANGAGDFWRQDLSV